LQLRREQVFVNYQLNGQVSLPLPLTIFGFGNQLSASGQELIAATVQP
jgi:hypothetical protein